MITIAQANPPGLSYFPGFLSEEEQQWLLEHIQTLTYTHDIFRGQIMKRSEKCFGYHYRAVGQRLDPAEPFDEFCTQLVTKALPNCPTCTSFDQCIIQNYPRGAGIDCHRDAKVFADTILGIRLGAGARLQFRPSGSSQACYEVTPAPGSLYVLPGPARWEFQHRVLPVKATRYSLTFRQVRVWQP
ncbi:MAG: alpha-ketoglutarate-dependent dioxygenase AlkB [Dehalococcoidia bacterium]